MAGAKAKRPRSRKVCFVITGAALTRITRDLVCEGKWPEAVRTLVLGLHGMTYALAFKILSGNAKLTGENNNVELEDDDDQEHRDRVMWLYAGVFRDASKNLYMQPYAFMSGWSEQDVGGPPGGLTNKRRSMPRQRTSIGMSWSGADDKLYRSQWYMDDPVNDWAEILETGKNSQGCIVLLRSIAQPPLWIEPHFNLQEALDAWLTYHELEERSALKGPYADTGIRARSERRESLRYKRAKPAARSQAKAPPGREAVAFDEAIRKKAVQSSLAAELAARSPFEPEEVETILEGISGEADWDSVPQPGNPEDSKHGYILPDGKFYPCKYMQHAALAQRLFKHRFGGAVDDPDKEADKRGWVKIQIGMLDKQARIMAVRRMTEAQRKTALEWCQWHNVGPETLQELM